MTFWAEAKRLSYVLDGEDLARVCGALGAPPGAGASPDTLRDYYRMAVCGKDGWPRDLALLDTGRIAEGICVQSLSGAIWGRTTGQRRKCRVDACPGWFIGVVWETGDEKWPCSEGWHYFADRNLIQIIGGGEISARFIPPKTLGKWPAPLYGWPTKSELNRRRGWRVNPKP